MALLCNKPWKKYCTHNIISCTKDRAREPIGEGGPLSHCQRQHCLSRVLFRMDLIFAIFAVITTKYSTTKLNIEFYITVYAD